VAATTKLVSYEIITLSTTTDEELKKDEIDLKKDGIEYKVSKIKRNSKDEIISIKIEFEDKKGNKGISEKKGINPIESIYLNIDLETGKTEFTKAPNMEGFVVDEKLSKEFGYEIKIQTNNDTNFPIAPTPPTPPVSPLINMEGTNFPVLPKALKAPTSSPLTNKKEWDKFELKMAEFEKKMQALEPEIAAWVEKMANFDEQMKPFEKEMEVFEKEMEVFEKQMDAYSKQVETYHQKKQKNNKKNWLIID
jgi:hypothetical protein